MLIQPTYAAVSDVWFVKVILTSSEVCRREISQLPEHILRFYRWTVDVQNVTVLTGFISAKKNMFTAV